MRKIEEIGVAIIVALVARVSSIDHQYEAFNCTHGTATKLTDGPNNTEAIQWRTTLASEGIAKIPGEDGRFSGKMLLKLSNEVFRVQCIAIPVKHTWEDFGCFAHAVTKAVTQENKTVFVDEDRILIEKPAESNCRRNLKAEWIKSLIKDKLETKHAALEGRGRQKRNAIKNTSKKIVPAWHTRAYAWYNQNMSKAILIYGLAYLLVTIALTIAAFTMRISILRSLKLSFPIFRRVGDLISYRKDMLLQKEAKQIMEARTEMGLSPDEPDIQDYAISHIKILYGCVQAINKRLTTKSTRSGSGSITGSGSRTPSPRESPRPYARKIQQARGKMRALPRAITKRRNLEERESEKARENRSEWMTLDERSGTKGPRRQAPAPPKPRRLKDVVLQEKGPNGQRYRMKRLPMGNEHSAMRGLASQNAKMRETIVEMKEMD